MPKLCDCHLHVYDTDARWLNTQPAVTHADLPAYQRLQLKLGSERAVIVQPLLYGVDNTLMLRLLRDMGEEHARGVAIVHAEVTDDELDALHAAGVRGVRFFVGSALAQPHPSDAQQALNHMRALDRRLAARGMHFQINTNGRFLDKEAAAFEEFSSALVFDHLGHVLPQAGDTHVGLDALASLLRAGNVWVKLSGLYLDSATQSPHPDMRPVVERLIDVEPRRLVWGTNWPHPTVHAPTLAPDDSAILQAVKDWLPDAGLQRQIFAENAENLYGFKPA